MGNQRSTFGKRQREQDRKDKARVKQERFAARRAEIRTGKGPPIASFAEAHAAVAVGPTHPGASTTPGPAISAPAPANREVPSDRPATPPPGTPPRPVPNKIE